MADTIELTEESTHEDIEAAVDQIIADQNGDESVSEAEETSDAEKLGSGKAVTERDPETDQSTNRTLSASTNPKKEDKSGEEESADWRDEAKAEASAYGFSEEDIADFETREELDRALKLFERQVDVERDKLKSEGEEDKGGKEPKGEAAPKEPTENQSGRYEVRLDPDIYDDEIIEEFNSLRDHYESQVEAYESRLEVLESRFADADAQAAEERFDRSVDSLQFSQLFGKTGEESAAELQRRADLHDHVQVELEVMERMGRTVDQDALVERVARSLFPEEYDKRLIKNHTRKVSSQANSRLGGAQTRPTDPPQTLEEEMRQYYKELEHQAG